MPLGPLLAVAFTVSQVGLPLDAYGPTPPSSTSGSGRIVVGRALSFDGIQTQRALVRAGDVVHSEGAARLRLRVVAAQLTAFADGSRLLDLDVRVTSATAAGCPRGSSGVLYLLDDAAGRDELQLAVCGREHYYNPLRGRISVTIG